MEFQIADTYHGKPNPARVIFRHNQITRFATSRAGKSWLAGTTPQKFSTEISTTIATQLLFSETHSIASNECLHPHSFYSFDSRSFSITIPNSRMRWSLIFDSNLVPLDPHRSFDDIHLTHTIWYRLLNTAHLIPPTWYRSFGTAHLIPPIWYRSFDIAHLIPLSWYRWLHTANLIPLTW